MSTTKAMPRAPAASDGRGRLPVPRRGPLPRAAAAARRGACGAMPGVRPLYDDGSEDPSAITRDYTLRVDDDEGAAPVLSVFGGKITTYRRLAEHALEKLAPYFPGLKPAWTAQRAVPGQRFQRSRGGQGASSSAALSAAAAATCCRASSGATARLAHAGARRRSPRRGLRRRADRARGELPHASTNGRAPPRTCCGGARNAACT